MEGTWENVKCMLNFFSQEQWLLYSLILSENEMVPYSRNIWSSSDYDKNIGVFCKDYIRYCQQNEGYIKKMFHSKYICNKM